MLKLTWISKFFYFCRDSMTAPTPIAKANKLIESINEMLFDGINNERLEEIIADTSKMKDIGLHTDAYNVLGMIAALRGDSTEVDRLFEAAMHSGGREPWTLGNYAAALNNLDRNVDAVKIIDEVVEMAPDDLSVIKIAIKFHREAFDIDGVRELMARCKTLGISIDDSEAGYDLNETEALMKEHNVTWRDMASRVTLASAALHQLGLTPRFSHARIEDGILVHEFGIDKDVEAVTLAENAMNDAIAENRYSPVDTFLYFSCSTV